MLGSNIQPDVTPVKTNLRVENSGLERVATNQRVMFKPLVQVISEIKDRVQAARRVSLFLDFDGTLVPIAADPAAPRLDPGTAETLKLIAAQDFVLTTIISGRAVEDLYSRIRLDGLI